jgi:GNAT superfamily N-acetyltransferase
MSGNHHAGTLTSPPSRRSEPAYTSRRPTRRAIVKTTVPPPVTITYLELPEDAELRPPSRPAPPGFSTRVVQDPLINRDLYRRVGAEYAWIDRLRWSDSRWQNWTERAETHLVELDGATAGYFELERDSGRSAKVSIFGLLGEYHGRGLGGHALIAALTRGREMAPRVWLTTCTLDGPHALDNYLARGMRPFRRETIPAPRGWAPRVTAP